VDGTLLGQFRGASLQLAQRNVLRASRAAGAPFVRLAHVDQDALAAGDALVGFGRRRLGDA